MLMSLLRAMTSPCWCLRTPGRRALMLLAATMSLLTGITLLAFTHQLFNNIINSVYQDIKKYD